MAGEKVVKKVPADPELRRQIEEAAGTGRPVGAVFTIQADLADLPEPDAVEAQIAALLDTVRAQTGQQPGEVQVFGNIGSFAVSAPAEFVARLVQQPEVVTASASQPAEDVLIRPVRRRSVAGLRNERGKKPPREDEDQV
jgi:hypothetical protein